MVNALGTRLHNAAEALELSVADTCEVVASAADADEISFEDALTRLETSLPS